MKIKWWQGTDALKLNMYPPGKKIWYVRIFIERILWKLLHNIFDEHWVNSKKLIPYLLNIGISIDKIQVKEMPYSKTIHPKKKHFKFNVLFYIRNSVDGNQEYKDWIYGRKIYDTLSVDNRFNVILINGYADMFEVYPITDCYIKIMKHAGSDKNRIAKECELNNIPVIYSDYKKTDKQNIEEIKCQLMNFKNDI